MNLEHWTVSDKVLLWDSNPTYQNRWMKEISNVYIHILLRISKNTDSTLS